MPIAVDFEARKVVQPLGQFQVKGANRQGVHAVVDQINRRLERPRSEAELAEAFEKFFPELQGVIDGAQQPPATPPDLPGVQEEVSEILASVRTLVAQTAWVTSTHNEAATFLNSALENYGPVALSTPIRSTFRVWTKDPVPDIQRHVLADRVRAIVDDSTRKVEFLRFPEDDPSVIAPEAY